MKRKLPTTICALALVSGSLALVACGGDEEDPAGEAATETTSETTTEATEPSGGAIVIAAEPDGTLAYTETELEAEAGAATVELENTSSTPHDVVIEDDSGSEVARTDVISGSSTTAEAELDPGTYTYFCSVPGHQPAGMEGTLAVE